MTWVKTAEVTFSGSSAVNIDGCFSSAFSHYVVTRNLLGSVNNENLNVRLRVSSTDDSGANYRRQEIDAASTTIAGVRATGESSWRCGLGRCLTSQLGYSQTRISNPFEAVRTTAWTDWSYNADSTIGLNRIVMAHDLTTSYTGFSAIPASGTITGTITVYGLKESA